jgi:UDP-N-acetylglucosamine--N-acetylmuramyl-(pentapeptide) pyrophosphoryl-undecaprenol N-acetylglucosamine transferase
MRRRKQRNIRLLLTGGGTGGHVYPLLAIHELLREKIGISDTLYVGSRGRAEERIVPRAGIRMRYVVSAPVSGLSPWRLLPAIWKNLIGTLHAILILLRFRPHLILASGGYVSAPVTFAAFLLRPFLRAPLLIDEQNVVPGLMNKVASLFAKAILVSFPETPFFLWNNRCVHAGYPVRRELLESMDAASCRKKLGIPEGRFVILVYGGSLGSRSINRLITGVIPEFLKQARDLLIVHSAGLAEGEYNAWEETSRSITEACPQGTVFSESGAGMEASFHGGHVVFRSKTYLHDIADYLAAADLVICRAGAGAITEICACSKAAIVIPKRDLPGNHQEHNAIRLAENQACEVVFEHRGSDGVDFIGRGEFLSVLERLLASPGRLAELGRNARRHFNEGFAEIIVETVEDLLARQEADYVQSIVEPAGMEILKQVDLLVSFLRKQPEDSFYRRLYTIKMEEYLESPDWHVVNNGIKLIGALGRADLLPVLAKHFSSGNGFMRRNALRALDHIGVFADQIPDMLMRALQDSYFEVRAAAFSVAGRFAGQLSGNDALVARMKQAMARRFQHFDVRLEGLHVLPLFLPLDEYLRIAGRYRFAPNARLRQAILEGLRKALESGKIRGKEITLARRFVREMLITTSDFNPQFSIRDSYVQLFRGLTEKHDSERDRQ